MRIAHRLLSQRVVQHDAVMATLAVQQPGQVSGTGWRFDFHKHLATDSQPFDVVAVRQQVESRERNKADQDAQARFVRLTEREREVLGLIVAGLTNKEIGRAPDVSPRTVETHRASLFAKLEAESLAMMEGAQKNPAAASLVNIPGYLLPGRGVPVKVGIGAAGIGGAPGRHLDEQCIMAALDKVKDQLK